MPSQLGCAGFRSATLEHAVFSGSTHVLILFSHYYDNAMLLLSSRDYICYNGMIDSPLVPEDQHDVRATEPTTCRRAALSDRVSRLARPRQAWRPARVSPWPSSARSDQGHELAQDAERRKLAAVADQALALADGGKLHLLQERHRDGDYSYWAVARALVRGGQA